MKKEFLTHNQEETFMVAKEIADQLKGGEILALSGNLGGGKTTFAKGLAEALRVAETITSPTFVMLKVYPAKTKNHPVELVHIDAYRAETIEDIKSVGIEDYLGRDDVILVVEWPERIQGILPQNLIKIDFQFIDEHTRMITLEKSDDFNY